MLKMLMWRMDTIWYTGELLIEDYSIERVENTSDNELKVEWDLIQWGE